MSFSLRSPFFRRLSGWFFAHMSPALPFQRLRETPTLLAFHHPRPAYRVHILLVPKRDRASLAELTQDDADFMTDLVAAVQSLVLEFGLQDSGYRLIANGGKYQDFPQLHFHLIDGQPLE